MRELPNIASPRELKELLRRAAGTRPGAEAVEEPAGFVFVAYARDDAEIAATLVAALEARDIAVEWDQRLLGGDRFRLRIGELIEAAAAVLVLWSASAVRSDFVIDEAEAGKAAGKLVTCRVPGLADGDIPFGFRQLHVVDALDVDAIAAAVAAKGARPRR